MGSGKTSDLDVGSAAENLEKKERIIVSDRFDLEQEILSCWAILEDIELVRGRPELIDSLRAVYEAKFQRCFDTFTEFWQKQQSVQKQK